MARIIKVDDSPASRLAPALRALLIAAFFVTSGVGYVWYKDLNAKLAFEITRLEPRLADLGRQNKSREEQLAALCSPVELDARVKKMNLGLGQPDISQVVHLPEPVRPEPSVRPADNSGAK